MRCKGCSSPIVGDRYRLVAEWPFCESCFERLQRPSAPSKPAAPVEAAVTRCTACERPFPPGELGSGGMRVCVECRGRLFAEPLARLLAQEEAEREAEERAAAEARIATPPEPVQPVGVAGKKTCAECGRRLIEPGGYKVLEGLPFCPACAHARPPAAPSPPPRATAPEAPATSCDACDRPLVVSSGADVVEGFFLCAPCRSVDVATALVVARAKHRARLLALAREVERSGR